MARYRGDEYDAWRDEGYVPFPVRRQPVVKEPVYEPGRLTVYLEEGEHNTRREKCSCGNCTECVGW